MNLDKAEKFIFSALFLYKNRYKQYNIIHVYYGGHKYEFVQYDEWIQSGMCLDNAHAGKETR